MEFKALEVLKPEKGESAIDPVCGMTIDPKTAAGTAEHAGKTFYFCSAHCRAKFVKAPEAYAGGEAPTGECCGSSVGMAAEAAPGSKYTCPMHPEIVQDHPGTCPKCGMALEPMMPTADDGPDPEQLDMDRRLKVAVALGLPVFALAMAEMIPGLHGRINPQLSGWLQLLLATPVVLWCAWPFFVRGWNSVLAKSPNMFTLIALGVGAAYLYSVVAVLYPAAFPEGSRTAGHAADAEHGAAIATVEPYFDTAAVVTALVLLGQALEIRARRRTGDAIRR
ncbi:MAG TPA: heavy metal-binding domain-containing protein, partial [Planctomycetia bacterium]|nr:heavy metal-binding domain-containing protein [Planctomycetia bacterium]